MAFPSSSVAARAPAVARRSQVAKRSTNEPLETRRPKNPIAVVDCRSKKRKRHSYLQSRTKPHPNQPPAMQALFGKLLPPILQPSSGGGDGSSNNRNGLQQRHDNGNHGGKTAHSNHANHADANIDHGNMMIITDILDTDILCGKDKTYNLHAGNVRYRHLIESHGIAYHAAITKHEKTKITRSVLDILDREQCRFLQPVEGGEIPASTHASATDSRPQPTAWTIVPRQKARDKTSHALRFYCQQHRPGEQPSIVPQTQQQPSTNKVNGHHVHPQHASSGNAASTKGKSDNAGGGGVDVVDGAYIFQRQQQLLREQLDRAKQTQTIQQQQQQQQQQQKLRPQPPHQTQLAQPQLQSPQQQTQQQHRLAMMMLMNSSPPNSSRSNAAGNDSTRSNAAAGTPGGGEKQDETFDTLRSQDVRDIIDEHYGGLSNDDHDDNDEEHDNNNNNDSIMNMMVVGNTSDTLRSQDLRMILDDDDQHVGAPLSPNAQQQRADDDDDDMMMEEG
jgi:hypothetical protein